MKKHVLALVAAGGVLAGGAAAAADFTFTVPVTVSHLPPSIAWVVLSCTVVTDSAHGNRQVGGGRASVAISGGGYSGDVVIAFNATLPEERHLGAFYTCNISNFTSAATSAGGASRVYYPGDAAAHPERFFPLNPGAPFVTSTGKLALP